MISVIIPALNAEASLPTALAALVPAAADGLIREAIVVDGGSSDLTVAIAEAAGAGVVRAGGGRGGQLAAGAARARFPWLLFLHADTALEPGWEREASQFMRMVDAGTLAEAAAAFRFALDDLGWKPRLWESGVALRCAALKLPYGDQGLLIPRRIYQDIGGYRSLPLMEDVEFVRRLGRRRVVMLGARATTSAERYRRDGYVRRSSRNLLCLTLYTLGVPMRVICRVYG
jgi:rSAM/selenodomain-associated transferase 2